VKLVQTVNQIARFFDSQPGDPAAQTLQHLRRFWARSMLRDLAEISPGAAQGLSPTARTAATALKAALDASASSGGNVQDAAGDR
jgi:hypothetical protein